MTISEEIGAILKPGIENLQEGHPDTGDEMNMLGRVVAAVEDLAHRLDTLESPSSAGG